MEKIIQWLIDDDQKELFEFLVALVLNIFFLVLITLLLWPLDKLMLASSLALGYGILWIAIFVMAVLLNVIQRFGRMNMYNHANAYVLSTLAVSCFLQMGWSAFTALTIHRFVNDGSLPIVSMLYLVGFFSCLIAFFAVSSIYYGQIYKLVSLPFTLVSFLIFSLWPASSQMTYGWFFDLL